MVERSSDQQRSSPSATAHVVEGLGRVAKRRPDSDRKREPIELDEPRHFRKRFGFRSKQDPRIIACSSGQSGAHLPLLLDSAKGAADPTQLVEALQDPLRMGSARHRHRQGAGPARLPTSRRTKTVERECNPFANLRGSFDVCGRPLRAHGRRAFRLSREASLRRRALRLQSPARDPSPRRRPAKSLPSVIGNPDAPMRDSSLRP
jgi:hypothetical protein